LLRHLQEHVHGLFTHTRVGGGRHHIHQGRSRVQAPLQGQYARDGFIHPPGEDGVFIVFSQEGLQNLIHRRPVILARRREVRPQHQEVVTGQKGVQGHPSRVIGLLLGLIVALQGRRAQVHAHEHPVPLFVPGLKGRVGLPKA